MVFVHARNATVKTAMSLRELATNYGDLQLFQPEQTPRLGQAEKQVSGIVDLKLRIYLLTIFRFLRMLCKLRC